MTRDVCITCGQSVRDDQRWSPIAGPATSADLLELDAVPEPVDSDAPTDVHARTLARART